MTLDEYIEREKTESNLYWTLPEGVRLNLLDEAIERLESTEPKEKAMRGREPVVWWDCTVCGNTNSVRLERVDYTFAFTPLPQVKNQVYAWLKCECGETMCVKMGKM